MNFATITAAQVCNAAIISLSVLWLFLVIDGLVGSAIACWQDVNRKGAIAMLPDETEEVVSQLEPMSSPVVEVTEAATEESVSAPDWWTTLEVGASFPCLCCHTEEAVAPVLLLAAPSLTKTAIAKMKRDEAIKTLPVWGLDPANYRTVAQMRDALREVAIA